MIDDTKGWNWLASGVTAGPALERLPKSTA
jgi:hypothetical protein